jgi:hypothetical protein
MRLKKKSAAGEEFDADTVGQPVIPDPVCHDAFQPD